MKSGGRITSWNFIYIKAKTTGSNVGNQLGVKDPKKTQGITTRVEKSGIEDLRFK